MTIQINKAVIPAAGLGTRFLPATKAQPKEMLPIVDKPTIQYVVEEAVSAGMQDILIITGRGKRAVEDHFDKATELEHFLKSKGRAHELELVEAITRPARIHYIRQGEPLGLGHAVLQAKDHVGDQPFVVLLGDDISVPERSATKMMIEAYKKYETSILAVQAVAESEVGKYGIIAGDEISPGEIRIKDVIEKPAINEAPSNLAIIGRYLLTPAIFSCLERTQPDQRGEIQLTDGLRLLLKEEPIHAVMYTGKRWDVGQVEGFITATIDWAMRRPELKKHLLRYMRRVLDDNL
ncbi:MAG TPA: UTP--glucose-1-phosphate uridylyltransferase GalU [Firmicutes bacterium]|nr:UTP--glucose-1-phosphate uridylyltransferase GalU [Bacillota bacterium]